MGIYDRIWDIAADDFGLITTSVAKAAGASEQTLNRYVKNGLLTRLGYGVYRVFHHVPGEWDPYAEAVKLAGPGAYLYGESVIAMHDLCPTNPAFIYIASERRIRRTLSPGKRIIKRRAQNDVTSYEGIPSQTVAGAIRSCMQDRHMLPERLLTATEKARTNCLIDDHEREDLISLISGS